MFCENCGKQINENTNFCKHCGRKHLNLTNIDKVSPNSSKKKRVIILLIIFILLSCFVLICLYFKLPQKIFKLNIKNVITDTTKKNSLEIMYKKIMDLDRNTDYAGIYEYLMPSEKSKLTRDEFIKQNLGTKKPISVNFTIHSIEIRGDRGIIDRTRVACYTTTCLGDDKFENRVKKEYFYINGSWYMPMDNNIYCDRDEEYIYSDEFKRAVSLILQRKEQSKLQESSKLSSDYKKITNCLDIQYSTSDNQLEGAEGYFTFDKNSTPDKLQIFISPKYKIKDDLLTSLLLVHEIHHAYLHSTGLDKIISCYENEAEAFTQELGLFEFDFNQEEKNSILNRYGSSLEIGNFINLRNAILQIKGDTIYERILPLIKKDPFYQKECSQ